MNSFWLLLLFGALLVVYPLVLLRAAARGRPWAKEALTAIACIGDPLSAAPTWLPRETGKADVDGAGGGHERPLEALPLSVAPSRTEAPPRIVFRSRAAEVQNQSPRKSGSRVSKKAATPSR